jgi:hypothetical protein
MEEVKMTNGSANKPTFEVGSELSRFMKSMSAEDRAAGNRTGYLNLDVDRMMWESFDGSDELPLIDKGHVHSRSLYGILLAMYEEKRSKPDGQEWYPHVFRDGFALRSFFKHTHEELKVPMKTNLVHFTKDKMMEKDDIVEVFRIVGFKGKTEMVCWKIKVKAYDFYKNATRLLTQNFPFEADYIIEMRRIKVTQTDWDSRPTCEDFPKPQ